MPKVSIIVPVYNAEDTLERCLDSLVNQTFADFEVLLINDGSIDSSLQICENYSKKDRRFKIYSQENQGCAVARNKGLDNASGSYIYFVDADDMVANTAVEKLYEAAINSGADVTICGFYRVKDDVKIQHKFPYLPGFYEGKECRKIAINFLGEMSDIYLPPYLWTRMIRTDVLDKTTLRFTSNILRSSDYLFTAELHFKIESLCLITDHALYYYIDNEKSITNSYVSKYWQISKNIYDNLLNKLPKSEEVLRRLNIMLITRSLIAFNNASRAANKDTFVNEVYEILNDLTLFQAIDLLSVREGFKRFKIYHTLMRFRFKFIVKIRYYLKFRKNVKIQK